MKMRFVRIALMLGLGISSSGFAQRSSPLSALPDGEFRFTGMWDCTGSFGNGKVHKSTFTGAPNP